MARGQDQITQRITLTGADEVKKQLAEMGKAGEDAIKAIDRATQASTGAMGGFARGVAAVGTQARALQTALAPVATAFGNVHTELTRMLERIPLVDRALGLLGGIAGLGAAFLKLSSDAAHATDELQDAAEAVGISVDKLLAARLAAAQQGADPEVFSQGFERFTRTLGTAELAQDKLRGVIKDTSDVFKTLGIDVRSFSRDQEGNIAAYTQVAKAIQGLGDSALKADVAGQIFGRGWAKQIELVVNFAENLKAAEATVERYKLGVTAAEAAQSKAYLASLATLQEVFTRIKTITGNILSTALVPLFDGLTKLIGENQAALRDWAQTTANNLIPVFQDLLKLLGEGLGAKLQTQSVRDFAEALRGLAGAGRIVVTVFRELSNILDGVAKVINSVFSTNFSGTAILVTGIVLRLVGAFGLLWNIVKLVAAAFIALNPYLRVVALLFAGAWLKSHSEEVQKAGKTIIDQFNAVGQAADANAKKVEAAVTILRGPSSRPAGFTGTSVLQVPQASEGKGGGLLIGAGGAGSGQSLIEVPQAEAPARPQTKSATAADAEVEASKTLLDQAMEGWNNFEALLKQLHDGLWAYINSGWAQSVRDTEALWSTFAVWFGGFEQTMLAGWNSFWGSVQSAAGAAVDWITNKWNSLKSLISSVLSLGGGSSTAPTGQTFAQGGRVTGPGGNDRVAAYLTAGEYVMSLPAVQKFGVDFMSAINQGFAPTLGFAAGGSVPRHAPRFATGGLVEGGGTTVVFSFESGKRVALSAPRSVAAELVGEAHAQQMRSTGVKPTWFAGRTGR